MGNKKDHIAVVSLNLQGNFVGDYFLILCNFTCLLSEKNVFDINATINKSAKIKNNTLTTSIPK